MNKRLCQFACKVTYLFAHVQAREENIARFSVAIVCMGGARGAARPQFNTPPIHEIGRGPRKSRHSMYCALSSEWGLFGRNTRSAIRGTSSPRKYVRKMQHIRKRLGYVLFSARPFPYGVGSLRKKG